MFVYNKLFLFFLYYKTFHIHNRSTRWQTIFIYLFIFLLVKNYFLELILTEKLQDQYKEFPVSCQSPPFMFS